MQEQLPASVFHFATSALPERLRQEALCDMLGRELLRVAIDPVPGRPLEVDMQFLALPRLGMASGDVSPMTISHLAARATDDDLVLVFMRSGHAVSHRNGRSVHLRNGQALLTANGEPASFVTGVATNVVNLRFDRSLLSARLARPLSQLTGKIPETSPALQLLTSYVMAVEQSAKLEPSLAERISDHLYDLGALALGATLDSVEQSRRGGVRAARLQAIKADIATRLGEHGLSAEAIGRRHGVSDRYVQMLFAEQGSTLSRYVAERRIEWARRMLLDPQNLNRAIVDIAYAVGFNDVSYFNRLFRRQTGSTPRDIRSRACGADGSL